MTYEYYPKEYYNAMTFKEIDELSMLDVKRSYRTSPRSRENRIKELMCMQDRQFYRYENFDRWKRETVDRASMELNDLYERINYFKSEYDLLPLKCIRKSDSSTFLQDYRRTLDAYDSAQYLYRNMNEITLSDLRKCSRDKIPHCCGCTFGNIKLGHDWCDYLIKSLRNCRAYAEKYIPPKSICLKKIE